MKKNNIYKNVFIDKENEEFVDILKNEKVRIERIVSNGQSSANNFWYDQDENEFILLLEGSAIIEFEDNEVTLQKGDYLEIKAKVRHRVKETNKENPTIWLAIFY